ncbi:MAG: hypothetical protein JNN28_13045 [Saprospiraceae bacterium]|nr:hypothetical protein [Saprospiraceae bacterium]
MNKFYVWAVALLSIALIVPACKDHNHDEDTAAPEVTIHTPTENESVTGEVHMEITVTDLSLHEMEVKVTKDSDGSTLYLDAPTVHDKTEYDYHEHFVPTVTEETPVTLMVTVSDHSDHTTTKTVKFTVKP